MFRIRFLTLLVTLLGLWGCAGSGLNFFGNAVFVHNLDPEWRVCNVYTESMHPSAAVLAVYGGPPAELPAYFIRNYPSGYQTVYAVCFQSGRSPEGSQIVAQDYPPIKSFKIRGGKLTPMRW